MRNLLRLLLFTCVWFSFSLPGNEFRSDPYKILGVERSSTQKQIQRQYRNLCLQHHPDKKVRNENFNEEDDDHAFKEVQHAYSLIGSEESRRDYDLKCRYQQLYSTMNERKSNQLNTDIFRQTTMFGSSSTIYFTFGGDNGISFKFSDSRVDRYGARRGGSHNGNFFNSEAVNQQRSRAHYVQNVYLPLEVLYSGRKNLELYLKTPLWERYKAAFKGGVLSPIITQAGLAVAMACLRCQKVNWFLSVFLFGIMIHSNMPPSPQKKTFIADIHAGWKDGTKLTFQTSLEDVTFVIKEVKHNRFTRCGNDLHTDIYLSRRVLRKGSTLQLEPLIDTELPIKIVLAPGQIREDGEIINVPGYGWPKAGCEKKSRGDLKVKIRIKKRKKKG